MTPRMCLICKQFFARIDNHLAVDHNLDRGSNRYQEMKELYKNETQRFLEHGFNRSWHQGTLFSKRVRKKLFLSDIIIILKISQFRSKYIDDA